MQDITVSYVKVFPRTIFYRDYIRYETVYSAMKLCPSIELGLGLELG